MNAAPGSGPQDQDHAGVRIPPPKLFLAGLALGFLLEWLWPLGWFAGLPTLPRLGLGAVLTLAGVALMASAMGLFKKAGTAIPPWEPTTALVTTGVYRFSRNPIYLSVVLFYVGLSLLFAWGWALLLLVPVLVILQLAVIAARRPISSAASGTSIGNIACASAAGSDGLVPQRSRRFWRLAAGAWRRTR